VQYFNRLLGPGVRCLKCYFMCVSYALGVVLRLCCCVVVVVVVVVAVLVGALWLLLLSFLCFWGVM
jgi:hypothetical protein